MVDWTDFQQFRPNNLNSLGIFGYLIVLNNQVHSYEMKALEQYLDCIELKMEDTCLDAIIKGVEESVSFENSFEAFSNENNDVKLCFLYQMYVLSYVDNHFADSEEQYIENILKRIEVSNENLEQIKNAAEKEAKKIRTQNNKVFIRKTEEVQKTFWAKIIDWFQMIFRKLLKRDGNIVVGDKYETNY